MVIVWLAACGNAPNGDPCDGNGDCASNSCQGNICSSGKCSQPGASCGDAEGWVCVEYGTFFGSYNACELLCAATEPQCPQWYSCVNDKHCQYGGAEITYSPTEIVANQPVIFTARLFDNDRTPEMAHWGFDLNGNYQPAEGMSATVTFPAPGALRVGFLLKYFGSANEYQTALRLTVH